MSFLRANYKIKSKSKPQVPSKNLDWEKVVLRSIGGSITLHVDKSFIASNV